MPEACFFASLTMLGCHDSVSAGEHEAFAEKIAEYQAGMGKWARHSPDNFEHKYWLVEADRERVDGRDWRALELYQAACEAARRAGYINNEALAYEYAGRFLLARGMQPLAAQQLDEARHLWRQWGATAKAVHLEQCYPELQDPASVATAQDPLVDGGGGREAAGEALRWDDLDLPSIVAASQSLVSEINLERLLDRMMAIVAVDIQRDDAAEGAAVEAVAAGVVVLHGSA